MSKRTPGALAFLAVGLVAAAIAATCTASAQNSIAPLSVRTKKATYCDVKFDLSNAIVNRGLVVDFNGRVSKMLDRTSADVGSAKPVYRNAKYFTFCSAKLSRQMMDADAGTVGFCPYVVFIYETVAVPGTIHVGFRRLPVPGTAASRAALGEINELLDGIIAEATQ